MAKTNKQVIEAWLRDNGERVSSGSLSCTPEGQLFSYGQLIGVWESADMNGPRRPVLWKYQSSSVKAENARISITTSNHVGLVRSVSRKAKDVTLDVRTPTQDMVAKARANHGPRQGRDGGW